MQKDSLDNAFGSTGKAIKIVRCRSLADFAHVYSEHFFHQRSLVFRGHAHYRWRLESSLTRSIRDRIGRENADPAHFSVLAQTSLAMAIAEFMEQLYLLGDREMRDLITEYLDLWPQAEKFTVGRHFDSMVTGELQSHDEFRLRNRLRHAEFRILALAQHYGMPTPLLDWSKSPYVAWYFALRESSTKYPTVVAISPKQFEYRTSAWLKHKAKLLRERIDAEVNETLHEIPDHYERTVSLQEYRSKRLLRVERQEVEEVASFLQYPAPSHLNERLQAQQGILTKHSASYSLEKIARTLVLDEEDKTLIWKFVLVEEQREKALALLRTMNITGATLFPGLVGAGQLGHDAIRFAEYSARHDYQYSFGTA